jgi:hypothetical protein
VAIFLSVGVVSFGVDGGPRIRAHGRQKSTRATVPAMTVPKTAQSQVLLFAGQYEFECRWGGSDGFVLPKVVYWQGNMNHATRGGGAKGSDDLF